MTRSADSDRRHAFFALAVLFCINTVNFFDRQILGAVTEPLRRDWNLSDTQIGGLGTAFVLLYAVAGLPLGRIADLWSRRYLLAGGLFLWSLLTSASGISRDFWSLFISRLGVGIGEASCAPAATSLLGDLFRPQERSRAVSIYMLGLPVGLSLSYLACGAIAQHFGWRYAFIMAGIPGVLLASLSLLMKEPARGAAEAGDIGAAQRPGSPFYVVVSMPTMLWIIASGALHNFNMYAISTFLPAYLTRYHRVSVQEAGLISGVLIGSVGALGTLLGGWLGDLVAARRADGRMLTASLCIAVSVPLSYLALRQPAGATVSFAWLFAGALVMMYSYYPIVYATIHDILEPALRGTGIAIYFLAMYTLGASIGPLATGGLSDHFAHRAAMNAAGGGTGVILEPHRAQGLLQAMHIIPVFGVVLALVLYGGSRTVSRDVADLSAWRRGIGREPVN